MSDVSLSSAAAPVAAPVASQEPPVLGYVALALMVFFAPAGVILAYIDRPKADALLASHYTYMIGTFWKGMLYSFVCLLLSFVLIGIFGFFLVSIWYLARLIKNLVFLIRNEPITNPRTWLF